MVDFDYIAELSDAAAEALAEFLVQAHVAYEEHPDILDPDILVRLENARAWLADRAYFLPEE